MGSGWRILGRSNKRSRRRHGGEVTVSKETKGFQKQGWATVLKAANSQVKMETFPLGGLQSCCGDFGRNISVVRSEERPDGSKLRSE